MDTSPTSSPPKRRGSTGSIPALGRTVSGGSVKTVKWIGKQIKNLKKDDSDSDSEELWGTSIERPSDLEDPNCPPTNLPSGYVPLYKLTHRGRPEVMEKHWHSSNTLSRGPKRGTRNPTKIDLKELYQPLTDAGKGSRRQQARRSGRRSKTPTEEQPPRPRSRIEQPKSSARDDVTSPAPKSTADSKKKKSSREYIPGSSSTWSGPRISKPIRRPDITRVNEIYDPPKEGSK
ncbi:hypothetical protein PGTUg99_036053 [Puccinia graminis f. sp. tritici]|uniref:Uncharacterized protein n=1 Tax=Puccinia graminis f. sp. tritici TaxID=56615 RepID=A0A5B0PMC4_PUCGR|nr:hypothetical protein PGTUg99_036053 [Puccinia graminis f. sp. tritici]